MKIGIIGEFNPQYYTHLALNKALIHSANFLQKRFTLEWIPTDTVTGNFDMEISQLNGILMSMGTPYRDMDSALKVIKYARENDIPLMAICGGFQHVLLEYARNAKGIKDAEHQETSPEAETLLITSLSCSLVGETEKLKVADENSKLHEILGEKEFEEKYHCNYGLNKKFEKVLFDGELVSTVVNEDNEIRAIELKGKKFFIATLFQHQLYSKQGKPSKLLNAFITASSD